MKTHKVPFFFYFISFYSIGTILWEFLFGMLLVGRVCFCVKYLWICGKLEEKDRKCYLFCFEMLVNTVFFFFKKKNLSLVLGLLLSMKKRKSSDFYVLVFVPVLFMSC